ncbi:21556_t:CDS:1, partial [Gigaspora rosea]
MYPLPSITEIYSLGVLRRRCIIQALQSHTLATTTTMITKTMNSIYYNYRVSQKQALT